LNFRTIGSNQPGDAFSSEGALMLAEKFFLVLETLRSQMQVNPDGSSIVVSTTQHVPVKLPNTRSK
jgi:hypothetical protein